MFIPVAILWVFTKGDANSIQVHDGRYYDTIWPKSRVGRNGGNFQPISPHWISSTIVVSGNSMDGICFFVLLETEFNQFPHESSSSYNFTGHREVLDQSDDCPSFYYRGHHSVYPQRE